jgi:hypothetical protein
VSTVGELAKAEADAADAENPDEEEEEGAAGEQEEVSPAPEQEPETAQAPLTEQQADRLFKRLETAAQRYLKTAMPLTEELGMPVQACPLCTFPGLAIPRQAHEVTSDIEAAVLGMIGKGVAPEYVESNQYERCDACNGWGEVLTGAQKDISRTAICNPCGGKGYKPVVQAYVPTPVPAPAPFPGVQIPYTPLPAGSADAWGRPAGHPHWGLDPAMVGSPNGTQVG